VAQQFLAALLTQPRVKRLLSSEHFSVDGTLLEAWASLKSFRPKDGSGDPPRPGRNGERDFHGERRRNDTHASTTDTDARLFRKGPGKEARLVFMGHALMENRNGLVVGAVATRASGHAERLAAMTLIEPFADRPRPVTLGADKGYDSGSFVMECRELAVTPHVAQNQSGRRSAIDGRTTRHLGYAVSQRNPQTHRGGLWLGPRRWPGCANCGTADYPRSIGNSPSLWPPMISSGCPNCSRKPRRDRDPRTWPRHIAALR
jgi:hypothetical protein